MRTDEKSSGVTAALFLAAATADAAKGTGIVDGPGDTSASQFPNSRRRVAKMKAAAGESCLPFPLWLGSTKELLSPGQRHGGRLEVGR